MSEIARRILIKQRDELLLEFGKVVRRRARAIKIGTPWSAKDAAEYYELADRINELQMAILKAEMMESPIDAGTIRKRRTEDEFI